MEIPSIPKGTRDFTPVEMVRRNYILGTIKGVFERYGYLPIETPAMENLSTLLGKYGEEGDRLIFRILNSGNYLSGFDTSSLTGNDTTPLTTHISEKGLRYDLTVPFARFVVQHLNEIGLPFKRYQIQPVWRADKPQKGRYREFYQCDVDVIGSNSLLNEIELAQIINDVFDQLHLNVVINLNNRKILSGIAEYLQETDKFQDLTVAVDKFEKVGLEKVMAELAERGFRPESLQKLESILTFHGSNIEKITFLKDLLKDTVAIEGLAEMEKIFSQISLLPFTSECRFDLTLARGLNYYTGAIFEVKSLDFQIGSVCGGGRYDDLTGIFGMKDISGVGVSFGADRIYDVLLAMDRFPAGSSAKTKALFVNFGDAEENYCLPLVSKFRKAGINTELYPDQGRLKKQMKYADHKQIPYVILVGEDEITNEYLTVKIMSTGDQKKMSIGDAMEFLSKPD